MKTIPLTKGKFAIVDAADYDFLMQWKWTASHGSRGTKWYAIRRANLADAEKGIPHRSRIAMHRLLMNCPGDLVVDHLNGDSLDNRRSNLEIITQEENMRRVESWKKKGMKVEECFL